MTTTLILVRHGQTEWNRVERFRGRHDVPLNEAGLAQAEAAGRRIAAEWQPTAVYSSPLSRAMVTAEAIARPFGLAVQPHPGLIDIDYGQWQGLTPDEVRGQWPDVLDRWYRDPASAYIPGGELLAIVAERAIAAVRGLAAGHEGEAIVLVSHVVVNRVILLRALSMAWASFWRIGQENGAINVLEARGQDLAVISLNDTCHLYPGR